MTIEEGRQLLASAKERVRVRRARGFFDFVHHQLNRYPDDGLEWYERKPHVLLLVLKWALASWRQNDDRPDPAEDDIRFILQTTWDAIGHLHRVEERPAIFWRRMLLQQIWFQRSFDTSSIARQFRIIGERMANSAIVASFTHDVGMTPAQFAVQLAHLAADAGDALGQLRLSEQRPQTARLQEHWLAIRSLYGRSIPELHREMAQLAARGTPAEVEVCEQSPLIRTPFISTTDGPVCLHHKLLYRLLESAVFDIARALDPRPFMNAFGPAFEDHVAEVLEDLDAVVIRESELMDRLVGNGGVVDFAAVSDDALVLLDAKGIEGHYDELYHNLPEELAMRLRTSLLRAVGQAVDTDARLPTDLVRAEVYFVCVTFKQVAVGDGNALRDLTVGTGEWEHDRWNSVRLPPRNMLFASIFELESMIALATARQVSLSQIVREIVQANADPATRKAFVEMHVMAYQLPLLAPSCLQAAAQRMRA